MPSYCSRCGLRVHGQAIHQPHLCSDLMKRLTRREKQVKAVLEILNDDPGLETPVHTAEAIVSKLANMGVQDD